MRPKNCKKVVSSHNLFKQKFLMVLISCGVSGILIFYVGVEVELSFRKPVSLRNYYREINLTEVRKQDNEIKSPTSQVPGIFKKESREAGHAKGDLNLQNYETENSNVLVTNATKEPVLATTTTQKPKEKMGCHLPLLNPFDESILKYIEEPTPTQCSNNTRYPLIFTTDLRSTLIQLDNPAKYGFYFCCYSSFQRVNGQKSTVNVSNHCERINKTKTLIPEHIEFIQISCTNKTSISTAPAPRQIVDMFGLVRLKAWMKSSKVEHFKNVIATNPRGNRNHKMASNLKADSKTKPKQGRRGRRVNVVVLGLDAVSHMNFIRIMPQTYKYLTGNLSGIGMWGYTKVGDNTFPNIVPAITGLFKKELDTLTHCWNDTDVFDKCPFIWKDFARQGYVTAYGEDAVGLAAFNYCKDGFNHPPTDYYEATLTGHQDEHIGHMDLGNANACYGPRLAFQASLDFVKKMAVAMDKERRYFQFIWATSLTHDNLNDGKHGDPFLLETLQWFQNEGYFEDTVFILMSDHGIRWGDIRDTFQGKMEERMPFLYFVFPQWFKEAYPAAVRNVMENKHKLTTPFDLYETFQDLLSLQNIQSKRIRQRNLKKNPRLPRGMSLFLEIPAKRTCADAEIPEHWCVCHNAVSVGEEQLTLVYEAARRVVDFINEMFKKYPQCLKLELDTVVNAQVVEPSESEDIQNSASALDSSVNPISNSTSTALPININMEKITFSLTLSVSPSNGTFETTTTRQMGGQWVISNEISRINLYGDQSHCVEDHDLKKFCFCDVTFILPEKSAIL